jgi:hypothetical protein
MSRVVGGASGVMCGSSCFEVIELVATLGELSNRKIHCTEAWIASSLMGGGHDLSL